MQPRAALIPIGVFVVLLGAWDAAVPYVGPLFGYPMPPGSETPAWLWTASHWQRHLAPGLAAVVGGLLLTGALGRPRAGRALPLLGGFLAFLAGTWIILGREIAGLWLAGGGFPPGDNVPGWLFLVTRFGYHDGTGLLIAALAAFALGLLMRSPGRPADDERIATEPVARERVPAREREVVR